MNQVELISDADCPNVPASRAQLLRAFTTLGIAPRWQEWDRGAAASPTHVREFASPTILVNGQDVAQGTAIAGSGACRVYADAAGRLTRVPAVDDIARAFLAAEATAAATPAEFSRRANRMDAIRKVEVFSAGCPACDEVVELVNKAACPSCEIIVLDMHDPKVAARAKALGVGSVPAVAIDGKLADC